MLKQNTCCTVIAPLKRLKVPYYGIHKDGRKL